MVRLLSYYGGNAMSIVPTHRTGLRVQDSLYGLADFDALWAPGVASWVPDAKALFWLAPKTPPPLTASKVVAWAGPDCCPMLFHRHDQQEPLGYLELNPMPGAAQRLWMGHCLIRPEQRGVGLGEIMVGLLLVEAFVNRDATSVSLVVFPDNTPAIRCYRAVGFTHVAEQIKYFPTTGRQHVMYEMRITRLQWQSREAGRDQVTSSSPSR